MLRQRDERNLLRFECDERRADRQKKRGREPVLCAKNYAFWLASGDVSSAQDSADRRGAARRTVADRVLKKGINRTTCLQIVQLCLSFGRERICEVYAPTVPLKWNLPRLLTWSPVTNSTSSLKRFRPNRQTMTSPTLSPLFWTNHLQNHPEFQDLAALFNFWKLSRQKSEHSGMEWESGIINRKVWMSVFSKSGVLCDASLTSANVVAAFWTWRATFSDSIFQNLGEDYTPRI